MAHAEPLCSSWGQKRWLHVQTQRHSSSAWVMRSVSSQCEPSAREETITPTTQALHSSTEALWVIKSLSQDPVSQGIDDLLLDDWQAASDRRSLSSVQRFDFTPVHPAFAHRSHRQLTCSHSHRYPHTSRWKEKAEHQPRVDHESGAGSSRLNPNCERFPPWNKTTVQLQWHQLFCLASVTRGHLCLCCFKINGVGSLIHHHHHQTGGVSASVHSYTNMFL